MKGLVFIFDGILVARELEDIREDFKNQLDKNGFIVTDNRYTIHEIDIKDEEQKGKNMQIKNAKIRSVQLGREDHGIMTFCIFIDCDSWSCGIGGYALDYYDKDLKQRVCSPKSMEAITKILDTVGVDNWEDLPGKYIRIKDNGWGSTVDEIGNIIEDKWFNLREFFSEK